MPFTFTDGKGALVALAIACGIATLVFLIQIVLASIRKISWWKNYWGYFCIWVGTGVCCAFFQALISVIAWIVIFLAVVCVGEMLVRKENRKARERLQKMRGRKRARGSQKPPLRMNAADYALTAISAGMFLCFSFWDKSISSFNFLHFAVISLWIASVFAACYFFVQYLHHPRRGLFIWNCSPVRQEGDERQTTQKWIHVILWAVLVVVLFVLFMLCN